MDRLSTGERIAWLSAALLFIFMFFDWFSLEDPSNGRALLNEGSNAWEALEAISIVLLVTVVATFAMGVLRSGDISFEPVPINLVIAVLGVVSVILIAFRIVDPPDLVDLPGITVETTRKIGVFLGLVAAGGIAFGGYRALREERALPGGD